MGLEKQYKCDQCATLLYGRSGTLHVHKTYFSIKGSVTVQMWNPETQSGEYVYVSPNPEEPMCFCNSECFRKYAEKKVEDFIGANE